MTKYIISLSCLLIALSLKAQQTSSQQQQNKAVFNKIEFFLNNQQVDSIYNMADESFQKAIPKSRLASILTQNVFPKGRIRSATLESFDSGIGAYRLDYADGPLQLLLVIDKSLHYNTFLIKPYPKAEKQEETETKTDTILTDKSVKESPLDFYVDSIAKAYLKKPNTASLTIGVIKNNQVKTYFFGETTKGNSTLPTETSLYEIGSVTKVFTATLLADLVLKNTISLDDAITKYLPDSLKTNTDLQKITFRSLANHTSGLPRLPGNLETVKGYTELDPYKAYDRKALYAYLKTFKAEQAPGEKFEYSNLGFGLLGELISVISKKTYNQLIQDIIAKPLSLNATTDKVDPKNNQLVSVYNSKGEQVPVWNFNALAGTGVLKSTVTDLLQFARAQFKMPETDIEKAIAETKQFTYFLPPDTDLGMAWHINMLEGITFYWHNGGTNGSRSFIGIAPDEKSAVVVLSNSAVETDEYAMKILDYLLTQKN
ncbi:serine hydrolase [Sphingobacterium spiritivorum]|uniref:serine hydrolase n=1 Tax=Sphingobacterium spiritivorum TaxID=258 RepID=UPI001917C8F4|nr:serine hydrolase [Sphingobacterium spiritivorum]QQT26522.1 serine hydrolase [Sphingobacterium spiritivorum]